MVQWIKLNQNNSFVNWMRLPLLCEISGAIHLVLVGLMAGSLAGRSNTGGLKNLKFSTDRTVRIFIVFNEGTLLRNQCISVGFSGKAYCEASCEGTKNGTPCFFMSIPTIIDIIEIGNGSRELIRFYVKNMSL